MTGGETNLEPSIASWWKSFNDPQLDSLVERAVRTNQDLRIAEARVREARALYRIASSQLWPTVDAGGSYARQNQSKNQPVLGSLPMPQGIPYENNVYQAGFDASWEVDVFGGNRRGVEAGEARHRPAHQRDPGEPLTALAMGFDQRWARLQQSPVPRSN